MTTMCAFLMLAYGCGDGPTNLDFSAGANPVQFVNEGVTLAGTLWLPEGPGPHPAMVYVHGSGRQSRTSASGIANHFNPLGIAVLGYDKRGVGESGGIYEGNNNGSEQNLTLLARDAAAGIDFLRAQAAIDPDQIGLWGVSQAGWIVPTAAVIDGRAAFTILMSGPTVTVGEENFYSQLTGDNSSTLATLSQEEISRLLAERGPSGFDPQPFLKQMDMPGLWMLGSADESIPIPETVAILDHLIGTFEREFIYRVWEGANHGLRVNGILVAEFWSVQEDFLFQRVGVRVPEGQPGGFAASPRTKATTPSASHTAAPKCRIAIIPDLSSTNVAGIARPLKHSGGSPERT